MCMIFMYARKHHKYVPANAATGPQSVCQLWERSNNSSSSKAAAIMLQRTEIVCLPRTSMQQQQQSVDSLTTGNSGSFLALTA